MRALRHAARFFISGKDTSFLLENPISFSVGMRFDGKLVRTDGVQIRKSGSVCVHACPFVVDSRGIVNGQKRAVARSANRFDERAQRRLF